MKHAKHRPLVVGAGRGLYSNLVAMASMLLRLSRILTFNLSLSGIQATEVKQQELDTDDEYLTLLSEIEFTLLGNW